MKCWRRGLRFEPNVFDENLVENSFFVRKYVGFTDAVCKEWRQFAKAMAREFALCKSQMNLIYHIGSRDIDEGSKRKFACLCNELKTLEEKVVNAFETEVRGREAAGRCWFSRLFGGNELFLPGNVLARKANKSAFEMLHRTSKFLKRLTKLLKKTR
ncbi:hypothetical protein ACFLY6_02550 [Candidatus Dependentiae bacterium]